MIFEPLIKGLIDWHLKYNKDVGGLCNEINNAKSDGIINTYTHSKSGINHTLTGAGAIMRFTATAPWIAGDTVTVNGTRLNPLNLEGQSLPAGAFIAGMQVVAIRDGSNLQFLTQSYADQFASINSQMANKANKNSAASYDLPLTGDYEPYIGYENAYAKDDSGMVCLIACFKRKDGQKFPPLDGNGNNNQVAMMPEGFRPQCSISFTGNLRLGGTGADVLNVWVLDTGSVQILVPQSVADQYQVAQFSINYPANS